MRKLVLAAVLTSLTFPALARDRHQSYFTYEDGGTVVRQGGDSREVEGRVNLPIFPGDQIRTARRGRAELRLADGNIIALDRNTTLRFSSILDSYDGESSQTVGELSYGNVFVHDGDTEDVPLRLDTGNASYVSTREAIYEVETDGSDRDVLSVFVGTVEVRTPQETSRVRAGEEVRIDEDGIYGSNTLARDGTTDFERWYLRRAERYGRDGGRHLNASLGYADSTLSSYGSWIYVSDYGRHVWRPYVSVGWRPYHYGSWVNGPSGHLVWVSDEPWGWVPYHYGRWSQTSLHGWVWLPGYSYAPAWVYWAFGPSYVGWVPAGYYDCYRPYNRWLWSGSAYNGYDRFDVGFGFNGRVRLGGIDLTPWTFVESKGLLSRRTDRAAMSIDAIRGRLTQDGDRAMVSGAGLTLGRNGMKDPASAIGVIARRGLGGGTGTESSGSATDMTPFFRRDSELSTSVRDRVLRSAGPRSSGTRTEGSVTRGAAGGSGATGGISRDRSTGTQTGSGTIQRGLTPERPASSGTGRTGSIDRSGSGARSQPVAGTPAPTPAPSSWRAPSIARPGRDSSPDVEKDDGDNRGRGISRPGTQTSPTPTVHPVVVPDNSSPDRPDSWRQRPVQRPRQSEGSTEVVPRRAPESDDGSSWRSGSTGSGDSRPSSSGGIQRDSAGARGSDVPRRVIEGIGGARVSPAPASGRSSRESSGSRPSSSSGRSSATPRVERAPERSSPPPAAPKQESSSRKEGNIKPE